MKDKSKRREILKRGTAMAVGLGSMASMVAPSAIVYAAPEGDQLGHSSGQGGAGNGQPAQSVANQQNQMQLGEMPTMNGPNVALMFRQAMNAQNGITQNFQQQNHMQLDEMRMMSLQNTQQMNQQHNPINGIAQTLLQTMQPQQHVQDSAPISPSHVSQSSESISPRRVSSNSPLQQQPVKGPKDLKRGRGRFDKRNELAKRLAETNAVFEVMKQKAELAKEKDKYSYTALENLVNKKCKYVTNISQDDIDECQTLLESLGITSPIKQFELLLHIYRENTYAKIFEDGKMKKASIKINNARKLVELLFGEKIANGYFKKQDDTLITASNTSYITVLEKFIELLKDKTLQELARKNPVQPENNANLKDAYNDLIAVLKNTRNKSSYLKRESILPLLKKLFLEDGGLIEQLYNGKEWEKIDVSAVMEQHQHQQSQPTQTMVNLQNGMSMQSTISQPKQNTNFSRPNLLGRTSKNTPQISTSISPHRVSLNSPLQQQETKEISQNTLNKRNEQAKRLAETNAVFEVLKQKAEPYKNTDAYTALEGLVKEKCISSANISQYDIDECQKLLASLGITLPIKQFELLLLIYRENTSGKFSKDGKINKATIPPNNARKLVELLFGKVIADSYFKNKDKALRTKSNTSYITALEKFIELLEKNEALKETADDITVPPEKKPNLKDAYNNLIAVLKETRNTLSRSKYKDIPTLLKNLFPEDAELIDELYNSGEWKKIDVSAVIEQQKHQLTTVQPTVESMTGVEKRFANVEIPADLTEIVENVTKVGARQKKVTPSDIKDANESLEELGIKTVKDKFSFLLLTTWKSKGNLKTIARGATATLVRLLLGDDAAKRFIEYWPYNYERSTTYDRALQAFYKFADVEGLEKTDENELEMVEQEENEQYGGKPQNPHEHEWYDEYMQEESDDFIFIDMRKFGTMKEQHQKSSSSSNNTLENTFRPSSPLTLNKLLQKTHDEETPVMLRMEEEIENREDILANTCYLRAALWQLYYNPVIQNAVLQTISDNHTVQSLRALFNQMRDDTGRIADDLLRNFVETFNAKFPNQPIYERDEDGFGVQQDASQMYRNIVSMLVENEVNGINDVEVFVTEDFEVNGQKVRDTRNSYENAIEITIAERVTAGNRNISLQECIAEDGTFDVGTVEMKVNEGDEEDTRATQTRRIAEAPAAITFNLNRYNFNNQNQVEFVTSPLAIPEDLTILGQNYEIRSVTVYAGDGEAGHYYVYVNHGDGTWERLDNLSSEVSTSTFEKIQNEIATGATMVTYVRQQQNRQQLEEEQPIQQQVEDVQRENVELPIAKPMEVEPNFDKLLEDLEEITIDENDFSQQCQDQYENLIKAGMPKQEALENVKRFLDKSFVPKIKEVKEVKDVKESNAIEGTLFKSGDFLNQTEEESQLRLGLKEIPTVGIIPSRGTRTLQMQPHMPGGRQFGSHHTSQTPPTMSSQSSQVWQTTPSGQAFSSHNISQNFSRMQFQPIQMPQTKPGGQQFGSHHTSQTPPTMSSQSSQVWQTTPSGQAFTLRKASQIPSAMRSQTTGSNLMSQSMQRNGDQSFRRQNRNLMENIPPEVIQRMMQMQPIKRQLHDDGAEEMHFAAKRKVEDIQPGFVAQNVQQGQTAELMQQHMQQRINPQQNQQPQLSKEQEFIQDVQKVAGIQLYVDREKPLKDLVKKWEKRGYTKEKIFTTLLQNLEPSREGYYTIGQIYYTLDIIYGMAVAREFSQFLYDNCVTHVRYAQKTASELQLVRKVTNEKNGQTDKDKGVINYKNASYYYPNTLYIKTDNALAAFNEFIAQKQNPSQNN